LRLQVLRGYIFLTLKSISVTLAVPSESRRIDMARKSALRPAIAGAVAAVTLVGCGTAPRVTPDPDAEFAITDCP